MWNPASSVAGVLSKPLDNILTLLWNDHGCLGKNDDSQQDPTLPTTIKPISIFNFLYVRLVRLESTKLARRLFQRGTIGPARQGPLLHSSPSRSFPAAPLYPSRRDDFVSHQGPLANKSVDFYLA